MLPAIPAYESACWTITSTFALGHSSKVLQGGIFAYKFAIFPDNLLFFLTWQFQVGVDWFNFKRNLSKSIVSRRKSRYCEQRFFKIIIYDKKFQCIQLMYFFVWTIASCYTKKHIVDLTYKLCKQCLMPVTDAYRWNPHENSSKIFTKWFCCEHSEISLY